VGVGKGVGVSVAGNQTGVIVGVGVGGGGVGLLSETGVGAAGSGPAQPVNKSVSVKTLTILNPQRLAQSSLRFWGVRGSAGGEPASATPESLLKPLSRLPGKGFGDGVIDRHNRAFALVKALLKTLRVL
jgi:hypothetical protein